MTVIFDMKLEKQSEHA